MSHVSNASAPTARQVRTFTRALTAQLTGRTRDPDQVRHRVHRNSYDLRDRRAQVFRPIGDGTVAGALSWIDCLLRVIADWDDLERRRGGGRPLGLHGLRVLETLLGRRGKVALDFRTGRLDPAVDTIAAAARVGRTTVLRALARLRDLGVLKWVRRTEATGNDGRFAPQRRQVSNAYWFTPEDLPARVLQRLRDLLARKRQRRAGATPPPDDGPRRPSDPALCAALDGLSESLNASPPSGQDHRSGVEG